MAPPNLAAPLAIYGKTALYTLTTSLSSVISNASSSGKLLKVNVIRAANTVTTNQTISVTIFRSAAHEYLIKNTTVAPNVSLVIADKNEYIYLEEGDAIYAQSSSNASVDLTIHYEDISNA
jgi:hypothetical protein